MGLATDFLLHERAVTLSAALIFMTGLVTIFGRGVAHWLEFWWMLPVAFLIALTVNTVGVSGSTLFVPFFIVAFPLLAFKLSPGNLVMVSLITETFGLSSASLAFLREGTVDLKIAAAAILGALPFVVAGSMLIYYLPETVFRGVVAFAILGSVILLRHEERRNFLDRELEGDSIDTSEEDHGWNVEVESKTGRIFHYCRTGYRKRFLGYGAGGLFQGIVGFGIGSLGVISMILTRIPIKIAISTSHAIIAVTALVASVSHLLISHGSATSTPWNLVFMTVPGVVLGGQVAPFFEEKMGTKNLEAMIQVVLVTVSILLVAVTVLRF